MHLRYFLVEAATSLKRGGWSNVIAVATIALALFVLGAFLLVTSTLDRLTTGWSATAEVSIYLHDAVTAEERAAVETALADSRVVAARQFISKDEAARRFRRDFPDLASAAADVGPNPFPASLDVRLRPGAYSSGEVSHLAQAIGRMRGVADVRFDRQWLDRLARGVAIVRWVGIGLAAALAIAAALTIAAVVRLTMYGRRDEVEIMGLVGAPMSAIRGPFIVEGVLQGGAGALIALGALGGAYAVVRGRLVAGGGGVLPVEFLPVGTLVALVAGGMLVGCIGGYVATRSRR